MKRFPERSGEFKNIVYDKQYVMPHGIIYQSRERACKHAVVIAGILARAEYKCN